MTEIRQFENNEQLGGIRQEVLNPLITQANVNTTDIEAIKARVPEVEDYKTVDNPYNDTYEHGINIDYTFVGEGGTGAAFRFQPYIETGSGKLWLHNEQGVYKYTYLARAPSQDGGSYPIIEEFKLEPGFSAAITYRTAEGLASDKIFKIEIAPTVVGHSNIARVDEVDAYLLSAGLALGQLYVPELIIGV